MKMLSPQLKPCLKRTRSQSFDENDQSRPSSTNGGFNSSAKRNKDHHQHVHWDPTMRDVPKGPRCYTNKHLQEDVPMRDVPDGTGPQTRSRDKNQHAQSSMASADACDNDLPGYDGPLTAAAERYCKHVLSQAYIDIHAASLPGVIEATTDLYQHLIQECKQFSVQNWFRANFAIQTRSIYRVIEYAIAGQELCKDHRLIADVHGAVNSIALQSDHGLGRAKSIATTETRLAIRYSVFASTYGFMMLSILASSAAFREAARTVGEDTWRSLGKFIRANLYSLEYFAKIRGLKWRLALERISQYKQVIQPHLMERCPDIKSAHPHTYIVPRPKESLRRPTYKGRSQINIQENIYWAKIFAKYEAPWNWPDKVPYPSNPTLTKDSCELCGKCNCACDILDCDRVTRPLVEIVNCGEKGNGIRLLQPIKKGDILDEYVGEIKPVQTEADDRVYTLSLDVGNGNVTALISSEFQGNWTRFINHSCRASTKFKPMVIARRLRNMVVATRDVDSFEELTIDYGSSYWEGGTKLCKCRENNCRYNSWNKIKKRTQRNAPQSNSSQSNASQSTAMDLN